jgi:hypothetical protein
MWKEYPFYWTRTEEASLCDYLAEILAPQV